MAGLGSYCVAAGVTLCAVTEYIPAGSPDNVVVAVTGWS
jgi:hypothetical protein